MQRAQYCGKLHRLDNAIKQTYSDIPPNHSLAISAMPPDYASDLSEDELGMAVYALAGNTEASNEFRLGTREYDWHQHKRGQMFCVSNGLVRLQTATANWLCPPQRAIWLPPGMPHQVSIYGAISGWNLLFHPQFSAQLPDNAAVFSVSPFLCALVERLLSEPQASPEPEVQAALLSLLLTEIRHASKLELALTMPQDKRLKKIAEAICLNPSRSRLASSWADWAGLSERSLSRLWRSQTGISFRAWRQQADLLKAATSLAQGQSVQAVADQLGYAHPSNFIAMFQRHYGLSPARFFHPQQYRQLNPNARQAK